MMTFIGSFISRKTAVVGAGYIAVELAGILQELGSDTSLFIRREQVSKAVGMHLHVAV